VTSTRTTLPGSDQLPLFDLQWPSEDSTVPKEARHARLVTDPGRDRQDVFNARLLAGLTLVGPYEIPKIDPCTQVPDSLISFSEARALRRPDPEIWVHFYEDDYRFIRMWNDPERHFRWLARFAGIVSPDFSIYRNMPVAQKIAHTYRNQLLGARMQADGINVIANIRLSGRQSIPYALAGAPRHSTVALGLHGCIQDQANRRHVVEEVRIVCDELAPAHLVVYGSAAYRVLDYPREQGIPVHAFPADTFTRSQTRKAAA
jgi:hypothetical protein